MNPSTRRAKLVVVSDYLSPSDLTSQIGILPDGSWELGAPVRNAPNAPIAKCHQWWITEEGGYTTAVDTLIERVAARLSDNAFSHLQLLVDQQLCTVGLSVYVQTPGEPEDGSDHQPAGYVNSGFHLTAERIVWLSRLHASLDIDIY